MVAVISSTNIRLMPTSAYRPRRLLKEGKAVIAKRRPFTIRLTERKTGAVQPVEVCMDTGYVHIGTSVKSEKYEYLAVQADTLKDEKEHHTKCRMYRRQRRDRLRYRAPRFGNRRRKENPHRRAQTTSMGNGMPPRRSGRRYLPGMDIPANAAGDP